MLGSASKPYIMDLFRCLSVKARDYGARSKVSSEVKSVIVNDSPVTAGNQTAAAWKA